MGLETAPRRNRLAIDRLAPLTGDYVAIGGQKRAWVTVHGKRLRIELAGQARPLAPVAGRLGTVELRRSAVGVSVSFDKIEAGHATGMKLWHNETQLLDYRTARRRPATCRPSIA